jgi:hypothetical protein
MIHEIFKMIEVFYDISINLDLIRFRAIGGYSAVIWTFQITPTFCIQGFRGQGIQ